MKMLLKAFLWSVDFFWVKLNSDEIFLTTGVQKSLVGVLGVLEAHEPIAAGQMGIFLK